MSYWSRVCAAILGRSRHLTGPVDANTRSMIAALELELRERDAKIASMQREYAAAESKARDGAESGAKQELQRVFKKLAPGLANLHALAALSEAGRDVAAADLVSLFRSLEKALRALGLEPVGHPGDTLPFDVAIHQRMSGGMVSAGQPVTVRAPGYRFGDTVLLKAMVSSKESGDE